MDKEFSNLKIELSENKKKLFNQYINEFIQYREKVNLISKNDINLLFEKHIYDSLAINLFLENTNKHLTMLDIGTGGGLPSVPVAINYDNFEVTAVDSIKKKINFIIQTSEKLGLKNITALCERAENLPDKYKNSFDIVTSRAMSELRIILEYSIPYVKKGGYFISYKSQKAEEELQRAQNAIKLLGVKLTEKIEYSLPIEESPKRVLLVFKKLKNTPLIYPRKNGSIAKKPL